MVEIQRVPRLYYILSLGDSGCSNIEACEMEVFDS